MVFAFFLIVHWGYFFFFTFWRGMLLEHDVYSPNCIPFQQPSEYLDRKMVRDARVETVPPSEEPMIKD